MPMAWTPEANVKLFLGVLEQLKEQSIKLSHQKLADYMGPECNRRSIDNQMTKLKKQASLDSSAQAATPSAPSTPAVTPKKRRTNPASKMATASKKVKQPDFIVDVDSDEIERRFLDEVKEDLKNLD